MNSSYEPYEKKLDNILKKITKQTNITSNINENNINENNINENENKNKVETHCKTLDSKLLFRNA